MAGSDGGTHGFLFADLRGYTGLVESRGAHAASQLLERYRGLTRQVVAEHGGAEIKTEGDSFYVVLPSASGAVRCGLALVAACARPPDGGEAIAVGVGIHAGEAVAHEGGYVGSAVNIAARVCAAAGSGQLLATGTVRELTRSVVDARFLPAGRRTLKGLADPVELYWVQGPGGTAAVRGRSSSRVVGAMAVLAVVTALVIGGLLIGRGASPGSLEGPRSAAQVPSASASATVTATPAGGGFPDEIEASLIARLPPAIAKNCVRPGAPEPAAAASLHCTVPTGAAVQEIRVFWFPDQPAVPAARIDRFAEDNAILAGECKAGAEAHGSWGGGSDPRGRVICFIDTMNEAWVWWSDDRAGILAQAFVFRPRLAEVEEWWANNSGTLIALDR